jgi:hypothetical protein
MTNNSADKTVRRLFEKETNPSRHASACPFLTKTEFDFLRRVWNRTDRVVTANETYDEKNFRRQPALVENGYTADAHNRFREFLCLPSQMTQPDLIEILKPLVPFYQFRLQQALDKTNAYEDELKKLDEIPAIIPEGAIGTLLDEYTRISNNLYAFHETLSALNDTVHGLIYLTRRQIRDNVVSLFPARQKDGPQND